jgi:hypothetical protein
MSRSSLVQSPRGVFHSSRGRLGSSSQRATPIPSGFRWARYRPSERPNSARYVRRLRARINRFGGEVAIKACLNGDRTRAEHRALPLTSGELATDAQAVPEVGAFAVHVDPRDAEGRQTMFRDACDAAVAAIRAAAPGLPVGLSTAATIDPDPFARAAAIGSWRRRPDFASVNVSELGWGGILRGPAR